MSSPEHVDETAHPPASASPKKTRRQRKKEQYRNPVARPGTTVDRSGLRHQARIVAMQTLFELDMTGHELDPILARLGSDEVEDVPAPVLDHATRLIRGVIEHRPSIDPRIEAAAPAFPMPQLAAIDRSVLRIAVYELTREPDIPFKVVINEAVEIAKRFGGPNSGRFVNGVLGTINDGLRAANDAS